MGWSKFNDINKAYEAAEEAMKTTKAAKLNKTSERFKQIEKSWANAEDAMKTDRDALRSARNDTKNQTFNDFKKSNNKSGMDRAIQDEANKGNRFEQARRNAQQFKDANDTESSLRKLREEENLKKVHKTYKETKEVNGVKFTRDKDGEWWSD